MTFRNPDAESFAGGLFRRIPKLRSCSLLYILLTRDFHIKAMGDQTIQPTPESPEVIAFATRMYDAARRGDVPIFEQALPAGLPPNMTNDKGDSLVRSPSLRLRTTRHLSFVCNAFQIHHNQPCLTQS